MCVCLYIYEYHHHQLLSFHYRTYANRFQSFQSCVLISALSPEFLYFIGSPVYGLSLGLLVLDILRSIALFDNVPSCMHDLPTASSFNVPKYEYNFYFDLFFNACCSFLCRQNSKEPHMLLCVPKTF